MYNNKAVQAGKRLRLALIIAIAVGVMEVIGGIISNSLALISDSLHVFTDTIAIAVALLALRLSLKQHTSLLTYGYHRVEVLATFINLVMLSVTSIVLVYEAYKRVIEPISIAWDTMLAIAVVGLAGNMLMLKVIKAKDYHSNYEHGNDMLIESAKLHIISDSLSSIGVIIASIAIALTSLHLIDIVVSLGIVGLIIRYVAKMVKRCIIILLEGVPEGIDVSKVKDDICSIQGVVGIHDLHVWSIASDMHALSVHVTVKHDLINNTQDIIKSINRILASKYGIKHTTIQVELEDIITPKPGSDSQVVRQPRDHEYDDDARDDTRAS